MATCRPSSSSLTGMTKCSRATGIGNEFQRVDLGSGLPEVGYLHAVDLRSSVESGLARRRTPCGGVHPRDPSTRCPGGSRRPGRAAPESPDHARAAAFGGSGWFGGRGWSGWAHVSRYRSNRSAKGRLRPCSLRLCGPFLPGAPVSGHFACSARRPPWARPNFRRVQSACGMRIARDALIRQFAIFRSRWTASTIDPPVLAFDGCSTSLSASILEIVTTLSDLKPRSRN